MTTAQLSATGTLSAVAYRLVPPPPPKRVVSSAYPRRW